MRVGAGGELGLKALIGFAIVEACDANQALGVGFRALPLETPARRLTG